MRIAGTTPFSKGLIDGLLYGGMKLPDENTVEYMQGFEASSEIKSFRFDVENGEHVVYL